MAFNRHFGVSAIEGRHAEAYVEPVEVAALSGGSVSKAKGPEKPALTPAQENRIASGNAKKAEKAAKASRAARA